ncbi:hypothetical protein NH8B_1949 [Pseudogulbenkiania sp. NH8B]|nr:hypothetical protein NH8B_1949 [Pseudogulbenkiania sp. NH8B]
MKLFGRRRRLDESGFDKSVKHWQFATGSCADATEFDSVLGDFEGKITTQLSRSIYKGVTEAMTNSAHHAYEDSRNDGTGIVDEKRWWMFSQEMDGELYVVFCDLGIGIPRSLSRDVNVSAGWRPALAAFMDRFKAHQRQPTLIKAAIEIGRTRTNKPNRGLGLPQIVETVDKSGKGRVIIHSNAGAYFRSPGGKANEILIQYNQSIMGTLIQWSVPIETSDGSHGEKSEH